MDPFDPIRRRARELHDEVVKHGVDPWKVLDLVKGAAELRGLELKWVEAQNPSLNGAHAIFDDQAGLILCSANGSVGERCLRAAHELGHAVLHAASTTEEWCSESDIDPSRSTETVPVGLQRVEDYGARVRKELQANVFGRELLFPRGRAKELHIDDGLGATQIAVRLAIPIEVVRQQLLDALLLPAIEVRDEVEPPTLSENDPSQDFAVNHRDSPFLLEAGPGTGKTRTLVRRVAALIDDGADPSKILVLTFSNRAAGELTERLARAIPDSAPKIWVGTFHAFGLDLMRRFHVELGTPLSPALFDRSDGVEMLEDSLPMLELKHYRNLWDPTRDLAAMLSAISRAKDELVDPSAYRKLGEAMLARSGADVEAAEVAQKCIEVATVYARYEEMLREAGGVDFGDLIKRPAELLAAKPGVLAAVRARHEHVLVDEYQDVNRASAKLLKLVAGDGKRLWVVGDARQSIYRFRGASSANMRLFSDDYPGASRKTLGVNYRSSRQIVSTYSTFAREMGASEGMQPLVLEARRGDAEAPIVSSYETTHDEAQGVATSILELRAAGTKLRDQAVLCRSNARVSEMAAALEAIGIPVLHLGSLFERDEIRELLCVLALFIDSFGDSLVRVGTIPRYRLSMQDCFTVTSHLREGKGAAAMRLRKAALATGVSNEGRESLKHLADDLAGIEDSWFPWDVLTTFLLDRTRRLAELAADSSVGARMRGIAIWQFLNFVRDRGPLKAGQPIRRTLDRVRQISMFGEERELRHVPQAALGMDAVRLMTVHGSKGLEFDSVHVPGLCKASFPTNRRGGGACPQPDDLTAGRGPATLEREHDDEEESLFFVATSRARRHLRISHFRKQANGNNRAASPFLGRIEQWSSRPFLPARPDAPQPGGTFVDVREGSEHRLTVAMLGLYEKCELRYFYTHALKLGGGKKPTPFTRTHDCIQAFIKWLSPARLEPGFDAATAEAEFDRIWQKAGPTGHAFAADYYHLALRLVRFLLTTYRGQQLAVAEDLPVVSNGKTLWLERIEIGMHAGVPLLRQVRTGRLRKGEYERKEYTLYRMAAEQRFGSARLEAVHLSDELVDDVEQLTSKKEAHRREQVAGLISRMSIGRFDPNPEAGTCSRCPHFFACGAVPHGPLMKDL